MPMQGLPVLDSFFFNYTRLLLKNFACGMFLLIPEKPVLFILLDEFALYSSFGNFFNV